MSPPVVGTLIVVSRLVVDAFFEISSSDGVHICVVNGIEDHEGAESIKGPSDTKQGFNLSTLTDACLCLRVL